MILMLAAAISSFAVVSIGKLLLQVRELRQVVDGDILLRRVPGSVILVIRLCGVERGQRAYLGHDRLRKRLRAIELRDVSVRDALLVMDETVVREYIRNQEQEDKRLANSNLWR